MAWMARLAWACGSEAATTHAVTLRHPLPGGHDLNRHAVLDEAIGLVERHHDGATAAAQARAFGHAAQFPGTIIHTVRRGDTVGGLAQLYGSTNEIIKQANGLDDNLLIYAGQGLVIPVRIPNPATDTPTPTPIVLVVTATPGTSGGAGGGTGGAQSTYIVQPGDTLFAVATRFNTTVATLAQLNGIVNANRIFIGQTLALPIPATTGADGGSGASETQVTPAPTAEPVPATYVVQPGDNLFRISLRFNVSLLRLAEVNGITNYNRVFIGQVLSIP